MDKFITNPKALIKNILITNDFIRITDEDYKTKESFLEKFDHGKKGFLDTIHQIEYGNIVKIIPFVNENAFQIFFTEVKKKEKTYLEFNTQEEFEELLNYVISKTNLQKSEVLIRSIGSCAKQVIYTIIVAILFIVIFGMATQIESGEIVQITGGKRGLKRLALFMAEILGTTNTIIVGSFITSGFSFWTYLSYKKAGVTKEIYN